MDESVVPYNKRVREMRRNMKSSLGTVTQGMAMSTVYSQHHFQASGTPKHTAGETTRKTIVAVKRLRTQEETNQAPVAQTANEPELNDQSLTRLLLKSSEMADQKAELDVRQLLLTESLHTAAVFDNYINHWGSRCWSPTYFSQCKELGDLQLLCRTGGSDTASEEEPASKSSKSGIHWENHSKYISCTFSEFIKYSEEISEENLSNEQRRWVYADYKYMREIFESSPKMLKDVDWSVFGFCGRDGSCSTFWMGSRGACTPCHYDTYGCNLIAQLFGKKKWTLFPPSESTKLYPSRVPFEESSVFSLVDIQEPDLHKFPLFSEAVRYEVTLEPGQVLYLPKHWWHFVECETSSISVNTWIELESDRKDVIKETVTAMLTKSFVDYSSQSLDDVYNPKEVPLDYDDGIATLNRILNIPKASKPEPEDRSSAQQCSCCRRRITHLQPLLTKCPKPLTELPKPLPAKHHDSKSVYTESEPASSDSITFSELLNCITHPSVLDSINKLIEQCGHKGAKSTT